MLCKQAISLIIMVGCFAFPFSQITYGQQNQEDEIAIPKNTTFLLELLSPISTATNKKDDKFSCKVMKPDEYAGALVSGHIKNLKRSGKANGTSKIDLAFDTITLNDKTGGFNAQVTEVYEVVGAGNNGRADNEGTVRAKSTVKIDVARAATGALIGALIGGVIAGGQGAAVGAAIGAGVGITTALSSRGPDLEFKQGTQFTVLTNTPPRREKGKATARQELPATSQPVVAPGAQTNPATEAPPVKPVGASASANTSAPPLAATTAAAKSTSTILAPPESIRPPAPRAPSSRTQLYTGNKIFSLSYPANWRESSSSNPVTIAPNGGYVPYKEQLVLTHGIRAGVLQTQSRDLKEASNQLTNFLLQDRPYLRQESGARQLLIAGREGLNFNFLGPSQITKSDEAVAVYTIMLRDGGLFYTMAVVPQDQLRDYDGAFQNIIRSIKITD